MGKYKVPHFDAKGEADQIFRDLGVPTTFLLTAFYWDNLIYFGAGPQRGPDGDPGDHLSDGRQEAARRSRWRTSASAPTRIFKRGREFINKTVGIAGEHLTGEEMARALTRALGQEVRYNNVPPEVYRELRLSRRGRPGQHVPVQARLQRVLLRRARPRVHALAESGAADVRCSGWRCTRMRFRCRQKR